MSIHQFIPTQLHRSAAIAIKDAVGQLTYSGLRVHGVQLSSKAPFRKR